MDQLKKKKDYKNICVYKNSLKTQATPRVKAESQMQTKTCLESDMYRLHRRTWTPPPHQSSWAEAGASLSNIIWSLAYVWENFLLL